jgi:hypothetical protein
MSLPGDDYLNQEPVKPIQMDVQEFVDYICAYMGDLEKRIEKIEKHILDEAGCEENTQDCFDEFRSSKITCEF